VAAAVLADPPLEGGEDLGAGTAEMRAAAEFRTALDDVHKIALLRLRAL